jgi:hypothetical protein
MDGDCWKATSATKVPVTAGAFAVNLVGITSSGRVVAAAGVRNNASTKDATESASLSARTASTCVRHSSLLVVSLKPSTRTHAAAASMARRAPCLVYDVALSRAGTSPSTRAAPPPPPSRVRERRATSSTSSSNPSATVSARAALVGCCWRRRPFRAISKLTTLVMMRPMRRDMAAAVRGRCKELQRGMLHPRHGDKAKLPMQNAHAALFTSVTHEVSSMLILGFDPLRSKVTVASRGR